MQNQWSIPKMNTITKHLITVGGKIWLKKNMFCFQVVYCNSGDSCHKCSIAYFEGIDLYSAYFDKYNQLKQWNWHINLYSKWNRECYTWTTIAFKRLNWKHNFSCCSCKWFSCFKLRYRTSFINKHELVSLLRTGATVSSFSVPSKFSPEDFSLFFLRGGAYAMRYPSIGQSNSSFQDSSSRIGQEYANLFHSGLVTTECFHWPKFSNFSCFNAHLKISRYKKTEGPE